MSRVKQMAAIREWLLEYMPQTPVEKRSKNFVTKQERVTYLKQIVNQQALRYKITKELIDRLQIKTKLREEDIRLAVNTVFEMIERELVQGYKVYIQNFGTFLLRRIERTHSDVEVVFRSNELWRSSYNTPNSPRKLGLGANKKIPLDGTKKLRKITRTLVK